MSAEIINLDDHRPHKVRDVLCLVPDCSYKWLGCMPIETDESALYCPKCGNNKTEAKLPLELE